MSVSTKSAPRKQSQHSEPIYFVECVANVLTTNTAAAGHKIRFDGFPVQYRQYIDLSTGQCACTCAGFVEIIKVKAVRDGVVCTVHNGRTCKHIRKAVSEAKEWGFAVATKDEPATTPNGETEAAPAVNYVDFFENY